MSHHKFFGDSKSFMRRWGWVVVTTIAILPSGLACESRREAGMTSAVKDTTEYVATIRLGGGISEGAMEPGFFPRPSQSTWLGLLQTLKDLREDPLAKSVYVELGSSAVGFNLAMDFGKELGQLREDQKVICHAHALDNAMVLVTQQGCDETWVTASGEVATVGIGAELSYLKGAFDKVGVQADMLAMGRYKSGGEALTRTEPSEASLGNLKEMLRRLRLEWLKVASSKNPALEARLEDGPWTPLRAQEVGLITHVGFPDEALSAANQAAGPKELKERVVFGPGMEGAEGGQLADLVRLLAGSRSESTEKKVVVLPALGSITMTSSSPFGESDGITASGMTKAIQRLREDESVAALVVRMNSPGGSPLASDLIWRELMLTREKKPVVISIGGMAASGGYYIASAGNRIISSPTAIVGSIGVFGGKIVLGGALEKVGITSYPVPASDDPVAGQRALYLSTNRVWDDASREKIRQSMRRIYDLFVERVGEGRNQKPETIYPHAEGAIFLATEGLDLGLVDELGGLNRAVAVAKELAGLGEDVPVQLDGGVESVLEALLLGPGASASEVQVALRRYQQQMLSAESLLPGTFARQTLAPFEAAISPMLQGESVVAALPLVLELH
ncbi:MAG: S49 family peptidase [Polyangiaceae bacterium]|nr:S49 family peptidase [Polyangiaceae bacterium]